MPYAQLGDIQLYYNETRPVEKHRGRLAPPPIVFLHGFTLDGRMWDGQLEYFGATHRTIAVDAKGHGKSDAPPTGYSRRDRVLDLKAFVDGIGLDRFHLVGLSMGGSTALGFALEHQHRLESLTLVSTGAAGYNVSKKISHIDRLAKEKGLEAARTKWREISLMYYKEDKQGIAQRMATMIDQHSGAIWMDPRRGNYPREEDLPRVHSIDAPTLIIAGSEDKVFVELAELLHQRIRGSNLLIYDGIGHMVNMEAPSRFNKDLERFITTQEKRKAR